MGPKKTAHTLELASDEVSKESERSSVFGEPPQFDSVVLCLLNLVIHMLELPFCMNLGFGIHLLVMDSSSAAFLQSICS